MGFRQLIVIALLWVPQLVTADPLRMIMADDFPPFYYQSADGQSRGVSFDIVAALCGRLGYTLDVTHVDNMQQQVWSLNTGSHDLTPNLSPTQERRKGILFSKTPHVVESHHLIVRADSPMQFSGDLEQLTDLKIGVVWGWTYGPAFDSAKFLEKEFVLDSEAQMRMLLSGGFDLAISNPQSFLYMARQKGVARAFRVLEPEVYNLPVTIGVSKRSPGATALVDALERELKVFQSEPEYRRILESYGFKPPSPGVQP